MTVLHFFVDLILNYIYFKQNNKIDDDVHIYSNVEFHSGEIIENNALLKPSSSYNGDKKFLETNLDNSNHSNNDDDVSSILISYF